jgi:hypothetical protein
MCAIHRAGRLWFGHGPGNAHRLPRVRRELERASIKRDRQSATDQSDSMNFGGHGVSPYGPSSRSLGSRRASGILHDEVTTIGDAVSSETCLSVNWCHWRTSLQSGKLFAYTRLRQRYQICFGKAVAHFSLRPIEATRNVGRNNRRRRQCSIEA